MSQLRQKRRVVRIEDGWGTGRRAIACRKVTKLAVGDRLTVWYVCVQMLWNMVLCQIATSKPATDEKEALGKAVNQGITVGSAQ